MNKTSPLLNTKPWPLHRILYISPFKRDFLQPWIPFWQNGLLKNDKGSLIQNRWYIFRLGNPSHPIGDVYTYQNKRGNQGTILRKKLWNLLTYIYNLYILLYLFMRIWQYGTKKISKNIHSFLFKILKLLKLYF